MKRIPSAKTAPSAFTLIELLVVIAIIAILAAVLLPVLAQAQQRAKAMQCMANTKQIGTAGLVYLGDNHDYFPFGPNVQNDSTFATNSSWFVMLLNYLGGTTNSQPKIYICPSDISTATTTFPDGYILFQEDYRANDYVFRDSTRNTTPLLSTTVHSPSDILMITEKEWNSPNYQANASDLNDWLQGWLGTGGKNYNNSGFERHNLMPTAVACDGHACRFKVPPGGSSGGGSVMAVPDYFPGLGDIRNYAGTQPYWSSPAPVLWMRDANSSAGF
jgi:prepilin-type N-terminal cleavage/methylation domain-containing protein